jgi:hypothetical protein
MKKHTQAEKKLALEWALGKISHAEVGRRLKKTSVATYIALALILRDVIKEQ